MAAKMKVLVTGASGLLGGRVVELARGGYEVVPTHNTTTLFPNSVRLDVTDERDVSRVLGESRPDVVIHAAAETNVDKCEVDRERARRVNALGTRNVAEACARVGARIVYVSTDYVFDGERGGYTEEDEPRPINYYGATKLEGEKYVMGAGDDYAIARASVIYGWHPRKRNFATWVVGSLSKGEKVKVVSDHYNSPTFVDNLAEMLLEVAARGLSGIFHTTGAERISRFDFAREIARAFGQDADMVEAIKMDELTVWAARRPRDSSLRVEKVRAVLKTKPIYIADGLIALMKMCAGRPI